jgi:serine phosphatase RsbU (regulator of sigma subunit)
MDASEEILRYSYRLDTLFDLSRSLFTSFDPDEIINTCLLSTMGNFGALKGFISIYELPSKSVVHSVSHGFHGCDMNNVHRVIANRMCDTIFDKRDPINCVQLSLPPDFDEIDYILPIKISPSLIGFMGIGAKIVGGPYSEEEKKLLVTVNNSLVVAFKNAQSFKEIHRLNADLLDKKKDLESTVKQLETAMIQISDYSRHLEKIIAALNVAQEVQQSFFPQKPHAHDMYDLAGTSLYCDETGGDYFDFINLPIMGHGTLGIAVGDVSGHGISSALLMAGVRAYLRGRVMQPGSAAQIMTDVNQLVCSDTNKTCQFMTLIFLAVDPATRRVTWVNAGHEPIYIYHPVLDRFDELESIRSLAIGVHTNFQYSELSAVVEPGQIVILTTDGVSEAHNARLELFGKERFKEIIRKNATFSAEEIVKSVIQSIEEFRGAAPQHDDITLVVLKFH